MVDTILKAVGPPVAPTSSQVNGLFPFRAVMPKEEGAGAGTKIELASELGGFASLQNRKEVLNQVAKSIHNMDAGRSLVDRARFDLGAVAKSFPPFPKGSVEREQYLNSVPGIRALIEKLTFPPEHQALFADFLDQTAKVGTDASDETVMAAFEVAEKLSASLEDGLSRFAEETSRQTSSIGEELYAATQSQQVHDDLARNLSGITGKSSGALNMILS